MRANSPGRFVPCLKTGWLAALLLPLLVACGGGSGGVAGPPEIPALTLNAVAGGFVQPVHITHAGDGSGRLFVSERSGVVRIVRSGVVAATPFLDLTTLVQSADGEQGLLAIAFPPSFATRGNFYVHYTGQSGIGDTVLARYAVSAVADVADPASALTLLTAVQPFTNHNGGQLAFGPDGMLYLALRDGGGVGDPLANAQNPGSPLGKILRLDVESTTGIVIPPDNPFANEVWALGLRNPWRFSFDRASGDLYIGDVGEARFEEIDFSPFGAVGGQNYGWNVMEGLHCFADPSCDSSAFTAPVAEYAHGGGDCAVTGGFVYRGAQYPSLQGIYFYGDFCSGRIWGLRRVGTAWENQLLLVSNLQISSFGEDEAGNLYVADMSGGAIYKIDLR
ncbi:MAG TPA: PQQ-dependent sugar dehydrogenase [Rhodocyclaceae bacterium]|nr:PQQ-dependent sugar dehydrogenase [Rhodocyclaceae bacterium]